MSDPLDLICVGGNMFARICLTVLSAGILHYYHERLIASQRIGLGLLGGLSFLTVPVVLDAYTVNQGTPFDAWASFGASVGMTMFLWGSFVRIRKHARANEQQIHAARDHLKARGKI